MICDKYKNALRRAAASNDKPDATLARHLDHCSTCRATWLSERELLLRIDRTLRAQVNQEPSPAFLAQLRLHLSKEVTRPGSNHGWRLAGAALAVILVASLYPLVNMQRSRAEGNGETHTIKVTQSAGVPKSVRASEYPVTRSRHHSKRPTVQVVRKEPEVLVPPDEQQAFAQFVACVAQHDAMAQAVVTPAANETVSPKTELPQVSFVQIADLQLGQARRKEWIHQIGSSE